MCYLGYFGTDLVNQVLPVFTSGHAELTSPMSAFTSFLGIILAFAVLLDLFVDKGRKPKDKKTDWFYTNKSMTDNLMIEQIRIIIGRCNYEFLSK